MEVERTRVRQGLRLVVLAAVIALLALLGPLAVARADDAVAPGSPPQVRAEGTNPRVSGKLAGYTKWVDDHGGAPDVLILGSSRAVQLDPELVEQLSGSTAYNASISSGAARELLGIGSFADLLTPGDSPHLVVMLDLEAFDRRTPTKRILAVNRAVDAALAQCRNVGDPACVAQRTAAARKIVRDAVAGARGLPPAENNQRPDGMQINGLLENLDKQGVDLTPMRNKRIQIRIDSYRPGGGFDRLMPIPEAAVAKLLARANARGDVPTVVLTAMHPDCIRRCGPAGWNARRAAVKQWLFSQARTRSFKLVDLSLPSSFGGGAGSFFDEIHLRPKAAAQVVRRLDGLEAFDVRLQDRPITKAAATGTPETPRQLAADVVARARAIASWLAT